MAKKTFQLLASTHAYNYLPETLACLTNFHDICALSLCVSLIAWQTKNGGTINMLMSRDYEVTPTGLKKSTLSQTTALQSVEIVF